MLLEINPFLSFCLIPDKCWLLPISQKNNIKLKPNCSFGLPNEIQDMCPKDLTFFFQDDLTKIIGKYDMLILVVIW